MSIKSNTSYYESEDGDIFETPFKFEEGSETLVVKGDVAWLAVLTQDTDCGDPLEEFEEGEFYQFNNSLIHSSPRPEVADFKRIVRANPGRVSLVYDQSCGRYSAGDTLHIHHTKGEDCAAAEIENADGYYICPDNVTDPKSYADGVMATYSAWCNGDVYGVAVWQYSRHGDEWEFMDGSRDSECWGFYSSEYAEQELKGLLEEAIK